jgi:hypothetical protein
MCTRSLHGNREVSALTGGANPSGPRREGDEPKPTMHDEEKSDCAIVAVKLANKVGQPAAEPMEPRAEAEENARQDGMHRTPSREGMSPGLARVRTAARLDKKMRFTALLHHVDIDLLREAYSRLKRDAASGVDGVTWHDYGEVWKNVSKTFTQACIGGHIGHNHHGANTSPSRMVENARSASRRWRTRSSNARWSRC